MDEQLTTNSPISDFENAVNASDIENPQPQINLPENTPNIQNFFQPSELEQQTQQQVNQAQPQVNEILSQIESSFNNLATQGQFTQQMENQFGISDLQTQLTDVTNELNQKSLAFRREQEAIQTEPGLTAAQRSARLADVSRRNNMELADLEVIKMARSNSLTNAQSIIDRKVELKFGDEQRRLDGLKFIYNENKGILTDAQDKLFQQRIKRDERSFDIAKTKYQSLEQEKLQLVRNAQANGANNSVMSSILKSESLEDAYKNAGSYGSDPMLKAQLANIYSQIGSRSVNIDGENLELPKPTGDVVSDISQVFDTTGAKKSEKSTTALGVITGLQGLASRNLEGRFIGTAPGVRFPFLRGEEARTERQYNTGDISAINLKVEQWASGASLTKEQERKVKKMTPDKGDTDKQIQRKINQLANYMIGEIRSDLATQGINYVPPTVDFFNQDPLGLELQITETDPLGLGI